MTLASKIPKYDFFPPGICDYIARRGERAAHWVERYHQSGAADMETRSSHALQSLRTRRIAEGRCYLGQIEQTLPSLFAVESSIGHIVSRWFYSVAAYLHYLEDDFEGAEMLLGQAERAIRCAVSQEDILLPFAHHCMDFRLQKARIARDRQQWIMMRDHLEAVQGMNENTVPLCTLTDGREVRFPQIIDFYSSIGLSESDRNFLRSLLDTELRLFMTKRAIRLFYTHLGPVIVY
ncbi:MAG TPA: hypothetical protein VN493_04860 [Thermoanaerobaculia bacterium]|nr:hypothetical protein [Thermoanaerobaculia bacterium]